jgi:sugar/nucleoside kinase (ribokinase family)
MDTSLRGKVSDQYDVLVQGRAFCDLTFSFRRFQGLPQLGQEVFSDEFGINAGGIFNIVSVLSGLGVHVGWLTQLGNDIFSAFIAEQARERGLSLELTEWIGRPMPLVTVGVSFAHDRLFLSYAEPEHPGEIEPSLTVEHLDRLRPRALFTYGEVGVPLMRAARERGIVVYVDTFWNPDHLRSSRLREIVESADVVAPNLGEALEMTGASRVEEAREVLSGWCRRGAIKCGSDGCLAWDGPERMTLRAIPVQARETTGAGDSFNAGLIYGLLLGYPFETCLQCANIAGGLSTLVLGGCRSGITSSDIDSWLERVEGESK